MSRSPDRYSPSASDAASSSPPAPPQEEASDRALGSTDGINRGTSANAALLESAVSASSAPLRSTIDASQSKLYTNPSFNRNHDPFVRQKSHRNPNFSKRCTDASSSSPINHSPREAQHPTSPLDVPPVGLMHQTQSSSTYHRAGHSGSRRGNHGGGVGGTPPHHLRHGNRREHDRGGYGWMSSRGFNAREPQTPTPFLQQRGDPRSFIQPQLLQQPPSSPTMMPFFGIPPQYRHVMPPMGYEIPPVYYLPPPLPPPFESMPIITHQAPSVVTPAGFPSPADYQRFMLVKQIEYYFSPENLCKDHFLRQNMDDHGWVAVSLIASFNRVKQSTRDIPYILDALHGSTVVEVHGEKLRRRGDWMRWILPHSFNQYDSASSPRSPQPLHPDSVLSRFHAFGLHEDPSRHNGTG
ncbi:la-related protein 1B-like [Zingiber officinale]|uniref:HTH La-type RNA-binding domain-containing protein n=1 Tax=Zingiber officinale TaxID=94328 RepID=A0A8J5F9T7_ZINOF|nr:la-related protein 1B-like [Zingiber officinale]KAG6483097.1 hypothetical protein ZIOFF_059737 [Zingiber officinale]